MYHSMTASQYILLLITLYLPAMVANMAPVFAAKYNLLLWLNKPVDLGISFRGKRILGENKTIRGFVVGAVAAGIAGLLLWQILSMRPYETMYSALVYGVATGVGALIGDAVKSFFKRRRGIASGELWIPFDQIDFVIGATLVGIYFVEIPFTFFLTAIIVIGFLSFVVSKIGFALHIKKSL